ncbi:protein-L-isoaspartate(D-aspartate) O-methyltransferase, partial [Kitasatospora sp. NPDC059803]
MNWDTLADGLRESGTLSADWESTFRAVPRRLFVPDRIHCEGEWIDRRELPVQWNELVGSDIPLVTQLDEDGTTPSTSTYIPPGVAQIIRPQHLEDCMRVLDVGP